MLSNPSLESSPGSSACRHRSADRAGREWRCAYSARFRRCSAGAPGFGCAAAARSIVSSTVSARAGRGGAVRARRAGRRHHARAGPCAPPFPRSAGRCAASATRSPSNARPPARIARVVAGGAIAVDERPVARLVQRRRRARERRAAVCVSTRASPATSRTTAARRPVFISAVPRSSAAVALRAISRSSSAIVAGLRSAPTAARNTPSAQRCGVRPSLS